MATDLTIEVLREIRDGIRELREDFNARLDQTNLRLDQTNQRLERVEHGLNDLGGFMRRTRRSTSASTGITSSGWRKMSPT